MEEQLTYYDDDLEPMGQAPRSQVHAQGLLHLVVHCWIVSPRPDGLWVWFQKRSPDKAEFPNYYDIAVGGHVSAGEAPQEAVLREIREEVGLELEPAAAGRPGPGSGPGLFGGLFGSALCARGRSGPHDPGPAG